MKKPLNVTKRLQNQFKELSSFTIFSDKVSLNKAPPGEEHYSYWQGEFYKKKGVVNEQVMLFPVRDSQLSIAFSINNQHDMEKAEIQASCKMSNKHDPRGLGVLIYTEPMNYETFKNKLNDFIIALNNNHGLKDSLLEVFSIRIPEYKDIQNYVNEEIISTKQKIKDVQSVIYNKNKKNITLVSVEDIEREILEIETRLNFLKEQLIIKNKKNALASKKTDTLEDLNSNLKKLKQAESELDYSGVGSSENQYSNKIKQVEKNLGISIDEMFALRQKNTLISFIKEDGNKVQITTPKKRI